MKSIKVQKVCLCVYLAAIVGSNTLASDNRPSLNVQHPVRSGLEKAAIELIPFLFESTGIIPLL
jgi:hypothetical protein